MMTLLVWAGRQFSARKPARGYHAGVVLYASGGVCARLDRIAAVSTADWDNTAWMHLNGHCGADAECWRIELAIESAKYKVTAHEGPLELRDYPAIVIAVVAVDGTRSHAVNAGFRLLADYIFGKNQWTSRIAMTAPVTQSPQSPGVPLMTNIEHSSSWTISFMMPAGYAMQSLPAPTDVRVHFERAPPAVSRRSDFLGFGAMPISSVMKSSSCAGYTWNM